jgi:hypothetical protein
MTDYKPIIEKMNNEIQNPNASFETLTGYEVVLESLVYKIYDVFGRNALLSMMYQIGSGPGQEIAERILKERNNKIFEDPFEAVATLLNQERKYYEIVVKDIKEEPAEFNGKKYKKLTITINNRCFFRESLKKRKRLKIGGPLCRINKAYYETAFKLLTGLKCEIGFLQNDEKLGMCLETVSFWIPQTGK